MIKCKTRDKFCAHYIRFTASAYLKQVYIERSSKINNTTSFLNNIALHQWINMILKKNFAKISEQKNSSYPQLSIKFKFCIHMHHWKNACSSKHWENLNLHFSDFLSLKMISKIWWLLASIIHRVLYVF